jgi:hypothetical protein
MQPPRVAYWDESLGRLVESEEPDFDAERFSAMMAAGCDVTERDTMPAPPPVPEEYDR